jgi:hypothetical protein
MLTIYRPAALTTTIARRTTLAEKTALAAEAKRRFEAAMRDLKAAGRATKARKDLVGTCDHLLTRIDVIQAYTRVIENIFHGPNA